MTPESLSSDELCAAARLAGCVPLPAFEPGWAPEEAGVAAAVAVRGLLARGLATAGDAPELTPGARSALDPLLDPCTLHEIQRDAGPAGRRRHVLGESSGRLLATERAPSIWALSAVDEPAADAVRAIAEPLIPRVGTAPAARRLTVSGALLTAAETLLAQDGRAALPGLLRRHGVAAADAGALTAVLASAGTLVTVRTARRTRTGARAAEAVTWLDAGPSGLWSVTASEDSGDEAEADAYTLTAADHATVRDALAALLGPAIEEPSCPTS